MEYVIEVLEGELINARFRKSSLTGSNEYYYKRRLEDINIEISQLEKAISILEEVI